MFLLSSFVCMLLVAISSAECQRSDWSSGHQRKCKDVGITTLTSSAKNGLRFRASPFGNRSASEIALVPDQGRNKSSLKPREVMCLPLFFSQLLLTLS